jgi:hypothetical protein
MMAGGQEWIDFANAKRQGKESGVPMGLAKILLGDD